MYQSNTKDYTEKGFKKLVKVFEETVTKFKLEKNSIEFDISKKYTPKHACLWNSPTKVGKPCTIFQKDSKLALVLFKGDKNKLFEEILPQNLYRIEDLELYDNKK